MKRKSWKGLLVALLWLAANVPGLVYATPTSCAVVEGNTVALWHLDGNGTDASGNGNTLVIKEDRVSWSAGQCGQYVVLGEHPPTTNCTESDGGALTAPGSGCTYPGSGDWTVEAWVRFPTTTDHFIVVQHYSEHVAGHDPFGLRILNGEALFYIDGGDDFVAATQDISAYVGSWINLAGVYRYQEALEIYLNGRLIVTEPTTVVPEYLPGYDVFVGGNFCGTSTGLEVDEVRLSTAATYDDCNSNGVADDFELGRYVYAAEFGGHGTGAGEFVYADNAAVASDGRIFVADGGRKDIQVFDSDLQLIDGWSVGGGPAGICVDETDGCHVFVAEYADAGGNQGYEVSKYTCDGILAGRFGSLGSGEGQFRNPADVAVDEQGNIYVVDRHNSRVQKFSSDFVYLLGMGSAGSGPGQLSLPYGLALDDNGLVYIADAYNERIAVFEAETGAFVRNIAEEYPFAWGSPHYGIDVDREGNLIVADSPNHRIVKFDSYGVVLDEWGGYGTGPGEFNIPEGLAVSPDGTSLLIPDQLNSRVQVFVTAYDCNSNGHPDDCDIASGTSDDCQSDFIPDECQLTNNDCNGNWIPDDCELDFDGDGVIDDCDTDIDDDGVVNEYDVCDYSPENASVIDDPSHHAYLTHRGTILGDLDGDCDCDLMDFSILQSQFTGPNRAPYGLP